MKPNPLKLLATAVLCVAVPVTSAMAQTAQAKHYLPKAEDFLLWPPAIQPYGYRIVDKLFASRPILKGPSPSQMARGEEVSVTYSVDDKTFTIDDFMARNQVAGLLVMKNGEIVLERYGLGLQEGDRWTTMSTVKSMTATLLGAAIQDGFIGSVDDKIVKYLPYMKGTAYDQVSVRNLLTMSSGARWTEIYSDKTSDVNIYSKSLADKVPGGVVKIMSRLEQAHPPGTVWHYNTGDTFLLGTLLSAATQQNLAKYMSEKIWQPCGMEFDAYYTLESVGGQEIGGSRAGVALRDFGRFAQFVLNDGKCGGKQILPPGWVAASASTAFELSADHLKALGLQSSGFTGYGYSWWLDKEGAMIAKGFAGQSIYIQRAEKFALILLSAQTQPPYLSPKEPDRELDLALFSRALRAKLK